MTTESPLGQPTTYLEQYLPELLHSIPRAEQRAALGLGPDLPFHGTDIWNAWELTWLDDNGRPRAAIAEIRVPADSPSLIESKSLKLYLNSFSMTRYDVESDLVETIEQDLGACAGADVGVRLQPTQDGTNIARLPGILLDTEHVGCDIYDVDSGLLRSDSKDVVQEDLYSHLLRSLCPVTNQPDSGSLLIAYAGPRIDRKGLLRYIVSYRKHSDFHESCVERIFVDVLERCKPERLSVYARYQRRGGIDINPFRSNFESEPPNARLWRQ